MTQCAEDRHAAILWHTAPVILKQPSNKGIYMHRRASNEAAVSAIAVYEGFIHSCPLDLVSDAECGIVEMYEQLAHYATFSNEVFLSVDCGEGVPGVWDYEVDEEVGVLIGYHFKENREFPSDQQVREWFEDAANLMFTRHAF